MIKLNAATVASLLLAATLFPGAAQVTDADEKPNIPFPVAVLVPSPTGGVHALQYLVPFPKTGQTWIGQVNTVYLPDSGIAWTGGVAYEARVALLRDRILGFLYQSGTSPRLLVTDSTNRYAPHLQDGSTVVQMELERYKSGRGQFAGDPCYVMRIEELLGPAVMRDRRGPDIDGWPDTNAFSHVTRPSKLQGVTVEGTNAVVVLEFGTNLLAKIAFDENVRPVWATTNGVSLGPIPTNTVRHIGVKADGQREIKVVY